MFLGLLSQFLSVLNQLRGAHPLTLLKRLFLSFSSTCLGICRT